MISFITNFFEKQPVLQDFITLFLGIVVEAFPFIVLGVSVSVIVGLFFKEEWLFKYLPKNRIVSHFLISCLGVFMPVCECGNVPVVRRFLQKGFGLSHSLAFLLAAPVVNPITFFSTIQAFNLTPSVAFIRIIATLIIANFIAFIISFKKNETEFLTKKFYNEYCKADHKSGSKLDKGIKIFQEEFIEVSRMLLIGAIIAAASQSFIPRDIIVAIGSNIFLSIIAMLLLAFIISICANIDAFFALSYANTFTLGSIMTFLVFGPMIDIKMLAMLRTTFTVKFLVIITILVTLMSILTGLIVNYFL
jgi:uncharacterized protein